MLEKNTGNKLDIYFLEKKGKPKKERKLKIQMVVNDIENKKEWTSQLKN